MTRVPDTIQPSVGSPSRASPCPRGLFPDDPRVPPTVGRKDVHLNLSHSHFLRDTGGIDLVDGHPLRLRTRDPRTPSPPPSSSVFEVSSPGSRKRRLPPPSEGPPFRVDDVHTLPGQAPHTGGPRGAREVGGRPGGRGRHGARSGRYGQLGTAPTSTRRAPARHTHTHGHTSTQIHIKISPKRRHKLSEGKRPSSSRSPRDTQ